MSRITKTQNDTHEEHICSQFPARLWSGYVKIRIDSRRCCSAPRDHITDWLKELRKGSVIRRCTSCWYIRANRIAGDDMEKRLFAPAAAAITMLPLSAADRMKGQI